MPRRHTFLLHAGVYACAFLVLNVFVPLPISRESICIAGPEGKPCVGTLWMLSPPAAVVVLGHGVTANQGVMAAAANAFLRNGYAAVSIDFAGHGRSQAKFDWMSNAAQVKAWCDWCRQRFPERPLAYLGHSMGGEAGDRAFRAEAGADAFISLGMLPRQIPGCKTLLALGRGEELFSPDDATRRAQGKADVFVSAYSDHALEPCDPILLSGIIRWLNAVFGFHSGVVFPWGRWFLMIVSVIAGGAAALWMAEDILTIFRSSAEPGSPVANVPPGRFNPFRLAAWVLRCSGGAVPPRSGRRLLCVVRGVALGVVLAVLLSWLLTDNVYTCSLFHPKRCLSWLLLMPVMVIPSLLTARALERFPMRSACTRFGVSALTWGVPLLLGALMLEWMGSGIAFAGMMLALLALILVFISAVYTVATRGAGDYRAGAAVCGTVLAWIVAFWFPLML